MIFKISLFLIISMTSVYSLYYIYNRFIYPLKQVFKKKNEFGYVFTAHGKYEHRWTIEQILGRALTYEEEVHHINGKKWDNRRNNLALMTSATHQKWHKRLDWMYKKKIYPSKHWQRKKLREEFGAILF